MGRILWTKWIGIELSSNVVYGGLGGDPVLGFSIDKLDSSDDIGDALVDPVGVAILSPRSDIA